MGRERKEKKSKKEINKERVWERDNEMEKK